MAESLYKGQEYEMACNVGQETTRGYFSGIRLWRENGREGSQEEDWQCNSREFKMILYSQHDGMEDCDRPVLSSTLLNPDHSASIYLRVAQSSKFGDIRVAFPG